MNVETTLLIAIQGEDIEGDLFIILKILIFHLLEIFSLLSYLSAEYYLLLRFFFFKSFCKISIRNSF